MAAVERRRAGRHCIADRRIRRRTIDQPHRDARCHGTAGDTDNLAADTRGRLDRQAQSQGLMRRRGHAADLAIALIDEGGRAMEHVRTDRDDNLVHALPRSGPSNAIPIGHPIGNTRVYVLDGTGRLSVPSAMTGELCIGGEGVARGYLNQPELTAEKFTMISAARWPHRAVYRTGDIARIAVGWPTRIISAAVITR